MGIANELIRVFIGAKRFKASLNIGWQNFIGIVGIGRLRLGRSCWRNGLGK